MGAIRSSKNKGSINGRRIWGIVLCTGLLMDAKGGTMRRTEESTTNSRRKAPRTSSFSTTDPAPDKARSFHVVARAIREVRACARTASLEGKVIGCCVQKAKGSTVLFPI